MSVMSAEIPNPCPCGSHPQYAHRCKPETPEQAEAREARLVRGYCICWGVVRLVDWEIGTECSRCGDTFITEAEYLRRRKKLKLGPTRTQVAAAVPRPLRPMHQRPVQQENVT